MSVQTLLAASAIVGAVAAGLILLAVLFSDG